jgi:hypothetical protein
MKWILIVLGLLAGIAALVALAESFLPKGHVASRTARYRQPPEVVWRVLTDCAAGPSWRSDVQSVERVPDREGREVQKLGEFLAKAR